MAVYTKINKKLLINFLNNYSLGKLISFGGIQEGVENSNYKIITTSGEYILTIFEKRVKERDLPFFVNLTKHLINKKFKCPRPVSNKHGKYINKINNKSCLINSFLKGKKSNIIKNNHCLQVGKEIARIHKKMWRCNLFRKNDLSLKEWDKIYKNIRYSKNKKYKFIFEEINLELKFLKKNWPIHLPSGIIHADVFPDNVFFYKNKFSGMIDFYFACNDFFAYDLAISINAWCFNRKNILDKKKTKSIISGYQKIRKLSKLEIKAMPILLRGAAMRFLLTRLNDILYNKKNALVKMKNPLEYHSILIFHKKNNFMNYIN